MASGRLFGEDRSDIEQPLAVMRPAMHSLQNLGPHLIAPATDGRTEPDPAFLFRETERRERVEPTVENAGGGPAPSGMQGSNRATRMPEQDRCAVGHRDRERGAVSNGHVAVGVHPPKPPAPPSPMRHHLGAVHLVCGRKPLYPATLEGPIPIDKPLGQRFTKDDVIAYWPN